MTDEEKLQQILMQLKRGFSKDLEKNTERELKEHKNFWVKLLKYLKLGVLLYRSGSVGLMHASFLVCTTH